MAIVLLPSLFAGGTAAAFYLRLHQASDAVAVDDLPLFPPPIKAKRYLILAPHCDDETLAVGGFVADATRKGASVSVAFFTNGDGFPAAATRDLGQVTLSPADYVRFAQHRQSEAYRAMGILGVKRGDIYFLGYPDRGLRPMWENNWPPSAPYRSFYTGHNHSPYSVSYTPRALYSGQSLQNDLTRLMDTVKPTDIFVTHPADDHPDHSAAATFAQSALRVCAVERREPWAKTARLHYYIVHRGDWPLPQGKRPEASLAPPAGLATADTAWRAYMISDATRAVKDRALNRYVSQLNICRRFLTSFVRTNELFGDMDAPTVPNGAADWTTVAVDGRRDDLARDIDPSADLTGIAVQRAETDWLTVRVALRGVPVTSRLHYRLLVREGEVVRDVPLHVPTGNQSRFLSARIRVAARDAECLWVSAETRYRGTGRLPMRPVDRIGYHPLLLLRPGGAANVSEPSEQDKTAEAAR